MRLARHYNDVYGAPCDFTNNGSEFTVKFVSQAQCSVTTSCLSELKYNDEVPCNLHNLEDRIEYKKLKRILETIQN